MNWLSRLFPPRWRRLAKLADKILADGTRHAAHEHHGVAAAHFVSAALTYEAAASYAPEEHRPTLRFWSSQCAYRAASECDAFGHAFKPPLWPHVPDLTSPTQPKPKERV